jgi:hypothetical protein
MLREMCGDDFRTQAASRIGRGAPSVLINSVQAGSIRQTDRSRQRLVRDVMRVPGAARHIFDRLGNLFNAQSTTMAREMLALGRVLMGVFLHLEGKRGGTARTAAVALVDE